MSGKELKPYWYYQELDGLLVHRFTGNPNRSEGWIYENRYEWHFRDITYFMVNDPTLEKRLKRHGT